MEKADIKKRRGKKQDYRMRTHLIHGNYESKQWDYDHHVIPPISATTTFRLNSVQRGAQGFIEFGHEELMRKVPIYIYDRLDEPTRGMLEENLINYIAENAFSITLAVSLGQIKTLIESPSSMTHSSLPDEEKRVRGIEPGGVRLSMGLEDWHDIIEDLSAALDQI